MASNGVIVHSNQLSHVGINRQVLKDGSSVRVRVISNNGNGQYTGSVAGVRVNLKSNQNLQVGSTFVASIFHKNGTVFVTPQSNLVTVENLKLSLLNREQILNLLNNLGLPPDKISLNLLQQFKQMEIKMDSGILGRFHNISIRFKGKEKKASELLSMFFEKGMNLSDEELLKLMDYIDSDYERDDSNSNSEKELLNRFNSEKGAWFIFPFYMEEVDSNILIGKGILRLLFNKQEKLNLINLDLKMKDERYLFSMRFQSSVLKTIKFNMSELKADKFFTVMKKKFPKVNIEWAESEDIEGCASGKEQFFSYEGLV